MYGFPTREDLERLAYIRRSRKTLAGELINTKIAGSDYQISNLCAVMEAVEKQRQKFLLIMATCTGKAPTCIALVDALMRANWAEKVLFLVDRIALRDQTLDAIKEHLPNKPRRPKQSEKNIATDRRIYISTYPTMLNVIRNEKNRLSAHFFDLIVVDESHRSIYNTYQEIKKLRKQIETLPSNSISVLDAKHELHPIYDDSFWTTLSTDRITFLNNTVKPLFKTVKDVDFKAMRFEKDIVEISLAQLEADKDKFDPLKESIVEEISKPPLTINTVSKEKDIIRQSQTNHY